MLIKIPIEEFNTDILIERGFRLHPDGSYWWIDTREMASHSFAFAVIISPDTHYATITVFDPSDPPADPARHGKILATWLDDEMQKITEMILDVKFEMYLANREEAGDESAKLK